jgi:hypothetical protein
MPEPWGETAQNTLNPAPLLCQKIFIYHDYIHNLFLKEVFIVLSPHNFIVITLFDSNFDSVMK